MTITLHWWMLPLLFAVASVAIPCLIRERGDWDMFAAAIKAMIFFVCIGIAAGILVGRWFA